MKRRLLLCLFSVALVAGTLYAQEAAFRHPGLLHSEEDFEAVRARLAAGDEHALEALEALRTAPPVNGDHGHNWGVNEIIFHVEYPVKTQPRTFRYWTSRTIRTFPST